MHNLVIHKYCILHILRMSTFEKRFKVSIKIVDKKRIQLRGVVVTKHIVTVKKTLRDQI